MFIIMCPLAFNAVCFIQLHYCEGLFIKVWLQQAITEGVQNLLIK
jgi:hypothetical protein